MSYATSMIRSGRTYDYEDSRASHRIQATLQVLAQLGAEPVRTHSTATYWNTTTHTDKHLCGLDGAGTGCKIEWPVWLTDEMIDTAWTLADRVIAARGAAARAEAEALRTR